VLKFRWKWGQRTSRTGVTQGKPTLCNGEAFHGVNPAIHI
jgi:hypothetical protein